MRAKNYRRNYFTARIFYFNRQGTSEGFETKKNNKKKNTSERFTKGLLTLFGAQGGHGKRLVRIKYNFSFCYSMFFQSEDRSRGGYLLTIYDVIFTKALLR